MTIQPPKTLNTHIDTQGREAALKSAASGQGRPVRRGLEAARNLTLLALLACTALLALPRPAQAQAPTAVWSATLTVSTTGTDLGCADLQQCSDNLTEHEFTDAGTDYVVKKIQSKIDGKFIFQLNNGAIALQGLTLVIEGVDYLLGDATNVANNNRKWTWANLNPGWSAGDTPTVQLVDKNVVATGQPTITGGAQVGKTLTASDDGIEERNGMPADPMFEYQWVRVDRLNPDRGTNILGQTSKTYTLTAEDVGDKFKVIVSFTDFRGNAEGPLPSAAYPAHGTVVAAAPPCRHHFGNDWCATMTVGTDHDPSVGKLVLGYESDDKYGSLTDNQIPYDGQAITVGTVYSVRSPNRTAMYFGSIPRVPRGTVVTVDGRSFTTDTESDDGSLGDQWRFSTGELPADLIWLEGQDVTVSVRFPIEGPPSSTANASSSPGVCPEATTVDIAYGGAEGPPASLITSATVSDDTLTVHVQAHLQYPAEVLEGYKMRFRELKPNREPWRVWSSTWTTSSPLTRTVDSDATHFKVEVVACTSRPAPSWMNTDRWYDLDQSNRLRVDR